MAKGAANEAALGGLHAKVAKVFIAVLTRYEQRMDVIDTLDRTEITDEVLLALLDDGAMPSPAMLSAITKFLKDNEINFDAEAIEELSGQERRLAQRKATRGNVISLTTLSASGE